MKNVKLITVILLFAMVLAACSGNNGSNGSANTGANADNGSSQAQTDGDNTTLVIANSADIESFDPHNNNNTYSEAVIINVFEYLVKNDADQNKVPGLATEWSMVNDTTWNFKLREGVTFHNGDPFTAADVKYSFERVAKDTTLKQNSYFKHITEVNVINDYEVEFVTEYPDPIFLNRLSKMGAGIIPAKYIEENGIDAFLKNPVGTGPYQFSSWAKDDRIVLVKNDNYYGDAPQWNEVVFRMIPEAATRVSELLTGGVDIITGVPVTDIDRINSGDITKVESATIQRVLHLLMRMTEGSVTADPLVREAIELAIDKQAIIDSIAGGMGTITRTSVTPGNFGADPSLYETTLYDVEKAKQLLAEAGYANGGLEITLSANTTYKEIAEVVAAMLTNVGFQVNLDILEPSKFTETYNSKGFKELFILGVGNSLFDASNNYNRFLLQNAAGETDYNNAEVEELLQAALSNMDPEQREKQYQQVQQHIANDRPTIYLYQMQGVYGVNKRIHFAPRLDEMFIVDEITIAQ